MQEVWPQKVITLNRILYKGENIYSIDGTEVQANAAFTNALDRVVGINGRQRNMVKGASGESGLINYRNYINVASNLQKPKSIVVIASPHSRQLSEVIPIVDQYIAPALFFDFAELMAEETGYVVSDVKFNSSEKPCITVTYTHTQERTHTFGPGEDFRMDGCYLAWTPSHVELGHYYERLVCSNGQTVSEERKDASVYSLSSNEIRKLIGQAKSNQFFSDGIEQFRQLFARASVSRISLSEMHQAQNMLIVQGVEKEAAEKLIPYEEVRTAYETAGHYDLHKEHLMKGEGTIWNTYNVLTQFATHAPIWAQQDYRRINLMNNAVGLLKKKPDIVNYMDIF